MMLGEYDVLDLYLFYDTFALNFKSPLTNYMVPDTDTMVGKSQMYASLPKKILLHLHITQCNVTCYDV